MVDWVSTLSRDGWYNTCQEYLILYYDRGGKMNVPPILKESVGFLQFLDQKEGEYKPLGTAFFCHIVQGGCVFPYLITCRHVVQDVLDAGLPIYIRLNLTSEPNVEYIELSGDWVFHEDSAVDLAVLEWTPPKAKPPTTFAALPIPHIFITKQIAEELGRDGHAIGEGDDVLFIGLFPQYQGYLRNFPIVRFGKIPLVTNEKIWGPREVAPYFFVECHAYRGNSGSPMYVRLPYKGNDGGLDTGSTKAPERLFLLGVAAGNYPKQDKVQRGPDSYEVQAEYGVSLVVPAQSLVEIIWGDKMTKNRNRRIDKGLAAKAPAPVSVESIGDSSITREQFIDVLKQVSHPKEDQPDEENSET